MIRNCTSLLSSTRLTHTVNITPMTVSLFKVDPHSNIFTIDTWNPMWISWSEWVNYLLNSKFGVLTCLYVSNNGFCGKQHINIITRYACTSLFVIVLFAYTIHAVFQDFIFVIVCLLPGLPDYLNLIDW